MNIPKFFKSPTELRKWFKKNHSVKDELWVGYYKKDSGKPSITWPQSVDEALCFGWIDGIRKSINGVSYKIRFTPRRTKSVWSTINIKRVGELKKLGLMQTAGLKAFDARKDNRSEIYSYEQRQAELIDPYKKIIKKNKQAWEFFNTQSPYYKKTISWWIASAKKEVTRLKRLEKLIQYSAQKKKIL